MQKFVSDFVLVASTLVFVASVALYLNYQKRKDQSSYTNAFIPEARIVYKDENGYPKYTLGACNNDSDCLPAGCSGQICSNDPGLITTCEIREDFPDQNIYSCGCVEGSCAWYR